MDPIEGIPFGKKAVPLKRKGGLPRPIEFTRRPAKSQVEAISFPTDVTSSPKWRERPAGQGFPSATFPFNKATPIKPSGSITSPSPLPSPRPRPPSEAPNFMVGKQLRQDVQQVKEAGLLNRLLNMAEVVSREKKQEMTAAEEKKFLRKLTPQERIEYKRRGAGKWEETDGMTFGGRSPNPFTKGADDPLPFRGNKFDPEMKKYAVHQRDVDEFLEPFKDKKTRLIARVEPEDMPLFERAVSRLDIEVPPLARLTKANLKELRETFSPQDAVHLLAGGGKERMSEMLQAKLKTLAKSGVTEAELADAIMNPRKIVALREDLTGRASSILRALRGAPPEMAAAATRKLPGLMPLWTGSTFGKLQGGFDWAEKNPAHPAAAKVMRLSKEAEVAMKKGDYVGTDVSLLSAFYHRGGADEKITADTQRSAEAFEKMSNVWRGAWKGRPVSVGEKSLPRSDLQHAWTREFIRPIGAPSNPVRVEPETPEWVGTFNPRAIEQAEQYGSELVKVGDVPDPQIEKRLGGLHPGSPSQASTVEELAERLHERNQKPGVVRWVSMPKAAVTPGKAVVDAYGRMVVPEEGPGPEFVNPQRERKQEEFKQWRKQAAENTAKRVETAEPYQEMRRGVVDEAAKYKKSVMEYADEVPPDVVRLEERAASKSDFFGRIVRGIMDAPREPAPNPNAKPSGAWYKLRGAFGAVRNEYKSRGISPSLTSEMLKPKPSIPTIIYQAGEWAKEGASEEEILQRLSHPKFSEGADIVRTLFSDSVEPGASVVPVRPERRGLPSPENAHPRRGPGGANKSPTPMELVIDDVMRRGGRVKRGPRLRALEGNSLAELIDLGKSLAPKDLEGAAQLSSFLASKAAVAKKAAPMIASWEEFAALGRGLLGKLPLIP